ncbi:hypothetical protein DFJ63DRAFT_337194 [Scheffersomyces coipomensis]|uniref:uncharacterized protein n=1 Tax=Scheffersomyces coipomensis TaxID=1788519 RepID=UPI00315CBDB4
MTQESIDPTQVESLSKLIKQYDTQIKAIEHDIKRILSSKTIKQLNLPLSPKLMIKTPTIENIITNVLTIYIIKIKLLSQVDLLESKYFYRKLCGEINSSLLSIINKSSIVKQYDKMLTMTTGNNTNPSSCLKSLYNNHNRILKQNIYQKIKNPTKFKDLSQIYLKNRQGKILSTVDKIDKIDDVYDMDIIRLDWYLKFFQLDGYDLPLDIKQQYLIKYLTFRRLNYDSNNCV